MAIRKNKYYCYYQTKRPKETPARPYKPAVNAKRREISPEELEKLLKQAEKELERFEEEFTFSEESKVVFDRLEKEVASLDFSPETQRAFDKMHQDLDELNDKIKDLKIGEL